MVTTASGFQPYSTVKRLTINQGFRRFLKNCPDYCVENILFNGTAEVPTLNGVGMLTHLGLRLSYFQAFGATILALLSSK
jgi:hypothetical protein